MNRADTLSTRRPAKAWERYWFGEAALVRLGAFRIVMLLAALLAAEQQRMSVFQHADELDPGLLARVWDPIYAFQLLGVEPMNGHAARIVWAALWVSCWTGILGIFTRASCAVAAATMFLWIGTSYSFGKPHHDCVPLMFGLLALPLAPVGARLSIDAAWARLRRTKRGENPADAPDRAPWAALPWRVTQVTVVIGYFFSGASKLAIGGVQWANGYTLQGTMLEFNSPWTATFTRSVFLCQWMSIGLLFVQATFPLVFASKKLRWFYVPMAVLFHVFSWQTMETGPFMTLWLTLASFVELDKVPAFVERHVARGAVLLRAAWASLFVGAAAFVVLLYMHLLHHPFEWLIVPLVAAIVTGLWPRSTLDVVYDGGCGICRTTIALFKSLDWSRRLVIVDLNRWEDVRAKHTRLDQAECVRDLHAVTAGGTVVVGYDAYRAISARIPLLFWFAPLMALPPVRQVGRRIYRRVADNRATTACAVSKR